MYARHAAKTGKILLKMLKMFLVSGYIHFENRILWLWEFLVKHIFLLVWQVSITLHKKWSFPLRISSVDLVTFTEEYLNGNFIFCAVLDHWISIPGIYHQSMQFCISCFMLVVISYVFICTYVLLLKSDDRLSHFLRSLVSDKRYQACVNVSTAS